MPNTNINLFLRTRNINPATKKTEPFTYLGKLAYVTHDTEREAPCHFKWQILDWEIPPKEILQRMDLKLTPAIHNIYNNIEPGHLQQTERPIRINKRRDGVSTEQFKARHVDFAESNERKQKIAIEGELLVLELEKCVV